MPIDKCEPNPSGISRICDIRNKAHDVEVLMRGLPDGRSKRQALINLETAIMWADKAAVETSQ